METTAFYKEMTGRNIGVISDEEQKRLNRACIAVTGCGGMGGLSAEQLVRLGVGHVKIADFDKFEVHNLSRQCCSTSRNVGQNKADILAGYFKEINPESRIDSFREGVTISRATGDGEATTVGSGTMWMNNSHAGHNATVGDDVILVNNVLIAGRATIGRGCVLGGAALVHQFTWVGERVMFQGHAGIGMHTPPFVLLAHDNQVVSLNIVGMKRAPDLTDTDRSQIKEAFRITYRSGLKPVDALAEMDTRPDWDAAAGGFRDFVRKALAAEPPYKRGLVPMLSRTAARRGRNA